MSEPSTKLVPLDTMRGVAAIVVAVGHFFLAFAPRIHGWQYVGKEEIGLVGTPLFALFNGNAAVVFFFVLSGFVLSWSSVRHQSPAILVKSATKRLPRLAGPVLLVNLLSATLAVSGLYANSPASQLTGSEWFGMFDFHFPGKTPSFLDASFEGTALAFFTTSAHYNPVLWTMFYEFIGSFLVFGLAFALHIVPSRTLRAALLVALWTILFCLSPYFSCFVVGVIIAAIYAEYDDLALPSWTLPLALGAVVIIWGYQGPIGYYQAMGVVLPDSATSRTFIYTLAALLLMCMGLWCPLAKEVLSKAAGKKWDNFPFRYI